MVMKISVNKIQKNKAADKQMCLQIFTTRWIHFLTKNAFDFREKKTTHDHISLAQSNSWNIQN